MKAIDKTIQTYDKIAGNFSESHFDPIFWRKEFETFRKLTKGKKMIEIGCGAGRDAVLFVKDGFDYLGTDASIGMLEQAKRRVKNGKFLLKSFYDLDFPDCTFDCFWAAASLLHVPKVKIDDVLNGIKRIIRVEGIGFISIKEKGSLDEGIIKENKFGGIERFFAFYTRDEFKAILNKNGFEIISDHTLKEENTNWLCYFVKKM